MCVCDTIDIRIADKVGNVSGWTTIKLARAPSVSPFRAGR
jgi:hypothetical protein